MAKSSEIQTTNLKLVDDTLFGDGERLPLALKDMGACGKEDMMIHIYTYISWRINRYQEIFFLVVNNYGVACLFLPLLEIFPQTISHHPNGRLIAVCGDGEYVIYTSQVRWKKGPILFEK